MTRRTPVDLADKRLMTREIMRTVSNALDKLPNEYKLPLWLSCEIGTGREEFDAMCPVSGSVLRALRGRAMCALLGKLNEEGIFSDELSVMELMRAMATCPAPASLIRTIKTIAGMPIGRGHEPQPNRGAHGGHLPHGASNMHVRSQRQDQ
ncbi:MAG: hypothetical protein C0404_02335 [Verrucomicrobia bacterium]|nr:hypothetical protein [Verrucomicrobiota bacterium]